jgi:hypothetical protein
LFTSGLHTKFAAQFKLGRFYAAQISQVAAAAGPLRFFRHLANSPKCQVFFSVPVLVCQWKITLLGPLPPHRVKTLDGLQGTFYLNCRCKEPHTSIQQVIFPSKFRRRNC